MSDYHSPVRRILHAWPLILVVAVLIGGIIMAAAGHGRNPWIRLSLAVTLSVFYYVCAIRIVRSQGKVGRWDSWLPTVYLFAKGVDHGAFLTVLFFIPVVHVFVFLLLSFKLAAAAGKSKLYGYLQLIPFVHIFAFYIVVEAIQERTLTPSISVPAP
jgi:hypothetical protein